MITYTVAGPLCHESVNGSDMVRVVPAETAQELLDALEATMDLWGSNAPHDFDVCEDTTCGCVRQRALKAIALADGR